MIDRRTILKMLPLGAIGLVPALRAAERGTAHEVVTRVIAFGQIQNAIATDCGSRLVASAKDQSVELIELEALGTRKLAVRIGRSSVRFEGLADGRELLSVYHDGVHEPYGRKDFGDDPFFRQRQDEYRDMLSQLRKWRDLKGWSADSRELSRGIDGLLQQYDNVPDLCESEGPCLQMNGRKGEEQDLTGYAARLSRDNHRNQFTLEVRIAPPADLGFPGHAETFLLADPRQTWEPARLELLRWTDASLKFTCKRQDYMSESAPRQRKRFFNAAQKRAQALVDRIDEHLPNG